MQNTSSTHKPCWIYIEYRISAWPMNRFEWVKAWILCMSQLWLACAFLDFNWTLHRNLFCTYAEHILNTQYTICQQPLNRFEWIKAWIVGMDSAQPQIRRRRIWIRRCRIWCCFVSFDCNYSNCVEYTLNKRYLHDPWMNLSEHKLEFQVWANCGWLAIL